MDKTVAGMIGAVAALTATASQAAVPAPQSVQEALRADSYADLLKPIPNARALLATPAQTPSTETSPTEASPIEQVQLVVVPVHHHHHHYHHRRRHYHHHHHHNHN